MSGIRGCLSQHKHFTPPAQIYPPADRASAVTDEVFPCAELCRLGGWVLLLSHVYANMHALIAGVRIEFRVVSNNANFLKKVFRDQSFRHLIFGRLYVGEVSNPCV